MTAVLPGYWPPWLSSTPTVVNDTNYTMLASDSIINIINLTAPRTLNLPLSASVPVGKTILIKDTQGKATFTNKVSIVPQGADSLDNSAQTQFLTVPYDAIEFTNFGNGVWGYTVRPRQTGNCNGQAANPVSLPNNVWTYVPLGNELVTDGTQNQMHPLITSSATMVTTGALPQASLVLNAIPADWPSAGIVVITGPNVVGHDTVVRYTGTSGGTTLTGCTGGVGTLAAGQVVKQANEIVTLPALSFWTLDGIVTFPATAAGILGVRFFGPPGSLFAGGTQQVPFGNAQMTVSLSTDFTQQLSAGPAQLCLQMFQTSGATIEIPIDAIEAPLLGGSFTTFM